MALRHGPVCVMALYHCDLGVVVAVTLSVPGAVSAAVKTLCQHRVRLPVTTSFLCADARNCGIVIRFLVRSAVAGQGLHQRYVFQLSLADFDVFFPQLATR